MANKIEIKPSPDVQGAPNATKLMPVHGRPQVLVTRIDPDVCTDPDGIDPTAPFLSSRDYAAFRDALRERGSIRKIELSDKPSKLAKHLKAFAPKVT